LVAILAGVFVAPRASADEPSAYVPQFKLAPVPALVAPSLLAPAEPKGDAGDLPPFLASQPLRLSLLSTIFPVAGGYEQCKTHKDESGNSINGFAIQRFTFLRLTPHLVLHGFSIAGCPIDGGLGGGLTYTVPLSPTLWLVGSGGYYGVPGRGPVLAPRTAQEVRLDLVKQTNAGPTFRIGIERKTGTGMQGGMQGVPGMVTFGGGF
jgi:hypothetical protein